MRGSTRSVSPAVRIVAHPSRDLPAVDARRDRDRLYLRLGVLVSMTSRYGLSIEAASRALGEAGYPLKQIPEELARSLSDDLSKALIEAGHLKPDEDPLDTMLAKPEGAVDAV